MWSKTGWKYIIKIGYTSNTQRAFKSEKLGSAL